MNIQLRDSRTLQTALKKRANRNMLPKAQLHPELLNGIVECDRESFTVCTRILNGEEEGKPNPVDAQNLADFLPEPATCSAAWFIATVKQGESMLRIPAELVFSFEGEGAGKLVVRTQAVPDVTKLTSALATDQRATFNATYDNGRLTLIRTDSQRLSPVSSLSEAEMQLQAAMNGVKWDKDASRDTMLQLITAAIQKKGKKKHETETAAT